MFFSTEVNSDNIIKNNKNIWINLKLKIYLI